MRGHRGLRTADRYISPPAAGVYQEQLDIAGNTVSVQKLRGTPVDRPGVSARLCNQVRCSGNARQGRGLALESAVQGQY